MSLVPQGSVSSIVGQPFASMYDDEEEFSLSPLGERVISPQEEIVSLKMQLATLGDKIAKLEQFCEALRPMVIPVIQRTDEEMSREERFLRKFLEAYYVANPQGSVDAPAFNRYVKDMGLKQQPPIALTPHKLYPLMAKLSIPFSDGHARERKYLGISLKQ